MKYEPSGGGGSYPSITSARNTVWIGGLALTCLDPGTGAVRAVASLQDSSGIITAEVSDVTAASDGRLFAIYFPTNPPQSGGVVELHPPAACDG